MTASAEDQHPRDRFELQHIEAQGAGFESALQRGRLHHAWLLTGPEGVGKASFAYRAARRLLGAAPDARFGALGAAPDDAISRMISARSHPDLLVLERAGDGVRKAIPVDEARKLPEFFAKAPAMGRYRVAIIDAVDDFNASGANAVLKTLEEPSSRGVLLLVSHAPGRLLPTIRSRCRTLAFRPWAESALRSFAETACGVDSESAASLATMAQGSPGRVVALARSEAPALDNAARRIVDGVASPGDLAAIADGFRGQEGLAKFVLVIGRLASAARTRAQLDAPGAANRWAAQWERLMALPGRVEGLNLDRNDAFWSAVIDIAETARAC